MKLRIIGGWLLLVASAVPGGSLTPIRRHLGLVPLLMMTVVLVVLAVELRGRYLTSSAMLNPDEAELLAAGGLYAELYGLQLGTAEEPSPAAASPTARSGAPTSPPSRSTRTTADCGG